MTNQTTIPTGVTRDETKGAITLDNIKPSPFKPKFDVAQIRQVFTTVSKYPSAKVESNMNQTLFDAEEFGTALSTKDYISTEERIAWILIPKDTTPEAMTAKLEAAMKEGAVIYKVLHTKPVLDDNQLAGVAQGFTTVDIIGNKQAARYGDTTENQEKGIAGKLILDKNGNVQYRRTFFWRTPHADIDARGEEVYVTPEIEAELHGAAFMKGQTIGA